MTDFKIDDIVKFTVEDVEYYGRVTNVTSKKISVCDLDEYDEYIISKDKAVFVEPVYLNKDTYQKLARYEITLPDVIKANVVENIVNVDNYIVTLEDIYCALKKFCGKTIDIDKFDTEWFEYFNYVLQETTYENEPDFFYNRNAVLSKTADALMELVFYDFEEDFTDAFIALGNFLEDESKSVSERRYPEWAQVDLLYSLKDNCSLNIASDEEAELYKKFAEELAEKGNKQGLLAVGYGCYGGDRVFPCDWKRAEECMLRLIDTVDYMPDQAFYANTLGYIYYYGRTTEGVPDYEKAYKYFSFAAFNRIYEAEYKVADMYYNGYGVPKSYDTARTIVSRLYEENLKYIQNGQFDCKFADIAFRMGNYCKDINNPYQSDFDEMLKYYYQADFAIRMRMKETNHYGDTKVAEAISNVLTETKEAIGFKAKNKIEWLSIYSIFQDHLSAGNWLDVKAKEMASGKIKLIFKPHSKWHEKYNGKLFITIPEIDMCGLYDSLTVIVKPLGEETLCPEEQFTVDRMDYNVFYFDGFPVMFCENCTFEIKKPKTKEEKYRFVSVVFGQGGKSYDYLCDDESIKIGDKIKVTANSEEKEVTVVGIFEKAESEIFLPIKSYKRI